MGEVIHWELCKKLKFDFPNKWFMHNPESDLEINTQTPVEFWETNGSLNLGQTIGPYNNQQKTCKIVDFAVPGGSQGRVERMRKEG